MLNEVSELTGKVTLLLGRNDVPYDFPKSNALEFVDAKFVRGWRPINLWRTAKTLSKVGPVDVIHDTFGNFLMPFLRAYKRKNRPVLVTSFYALERWRIDNVWKTQGYNTISLLLNQSGRRMYLGAITQFLMSKFADHVVLQSPGLIQRLAESIHISQDKVRVITNSVNTDFWTPGVSEYSRQENNFGLLYVGGLDNSHGLMSTLRVMKGIHDLGHKITLNLVIKAGIGELNTIIKYIEKLGLFPFVVIEQNLSRNQMKERYNLADALVYQTINDGSPRVVLEAMSCGLPIVASNHPGIDILDPDSKIISFTGFCDEKSMKAEIVQLIEKPGMGMRVGEAGRAMVREKFDTEPIAKQYAVFYQEILLAKARM